VVKAGVHSDRVNYVSATKVVRLYCIIVLQEVLTPHTEKECVWRHYNLSTQRIFHNVDPYGLLLFLQRVYAAVHECMVSGENGLKQKPKVVLVVVYS